MISPGLVIISEQYKVDIGTVSTYMVGTIVLFTGAITFFTASGANVWGKRPFFVISTMLLLLSNIWGYFADVRGPRPLHSWASLTSTTSLSLP